MSCGNWLDERRREYERTAYNGALKFHATPEQGRVLRDMGQRRAAIAKLREKRDTPAVRYLRSGMTATEYRREYRSEPPTPTQTDIDVAAALNSLNENICDLFKQADALGVPFWVQNCVLAFGEDWRLAACVYMGEWLEKYRSIYGIAG